jgi:nucleolar GTP-binding protein
VKLTDILESFPKVEEVHPFYGDLINVLYDKDHYKLALGHIKASKNMVENLAKDYLKLAKYADSLYRCKSLKKAALGRMCTILKKISSSLAYLEEVRKHLARLPSINPFERTILVTGYPNVGKSSFVNSVSKANVEVQPYPFTTQALYVGHTEYNNIRFQVIDSPGIMDRPLEQMNTIEMQSVTALAHLNSCILYFLDLSEQCGYSLKDQIHLHSNIKPLFKNKAVVIVLNKIDLKKVSELTQGNQQMLHNWLTENNYPFVEVSALNKDGTDNVRDMACDLIMKQRASQNIDRLTGGNQVLKNEESVLRGIYIAKPKPRDNK